MRCAAGSSRRRSSAGGIKKREGGKKDEETLGRAQGAFAVPRQQSPASHGRSRLCTVRANVRGRVQPRWAGVTGGRRRAGAVAAVPLPEPGDPPLSLGNGRSRCGGKSEPSCRTADTCLWPCPRYPKCGAVCFNFLLRAREMWVFLGKVLRALTNTT